MALVFFFLLLVFGLLGSHPAAAPEASSPCARVRGHMRACVHDRAMHCDRSGDHAPVIRGSLVVETIIVSSNS